MKVVKWIIIVLLLLCAAVAIYDSTLPPPSDGVEEARCERLCEPMGYRLMWAGSELMGWTPVCDCSHIYQSPPAVETNANRQVTTGGTNGIEPTLFQSSGLSSILGLDAQDAQSRICSSTWESIPEWSVQAWSVYRCEATLPGLDRAVVLCLDSQIYKAIGVRFIEGEAEAEEYFQRLTSSLETNHSCRRVFLDHRPDPAVIEQTDFTCDTYDATTGLNHDQQRRMVLLTIGNQALYRSHRAARSRYANTACGSPNSEPLDGVAAQDWDSWGCIAQNEADENWDSCLQRRDYTDERDRGCPGSERCCPPKVVTLSIERIRDRASRAFYLGNYFYDVRSIERSRRLGSRYYRAHPEHGATFVVVRYTQSNVTMMPQSVLGLAIGLVDSRGRIFNPPQNLQVALATEDDTEIEQPIELQPGVVHERSLAFEVPVGVLSEQVQLIFQDQTAIPVQQHSVEVKVE